MHRAVLPLRSPLMMPLALGAAAIGAAITAYAVTPGSTVLLPCPLYATTGILCPACGTTRALHALTHGDISVALHNNAVFVIAIPLLVYAWMSWFTERLGNDGLPKPRFGGPASFIIAGVVIAFTVARNIDVSLFDALRPIAV